MSWFAGKNNQLLRNTIDYYTYSEAELQQQC